MDTYLTWVRNGIDNIDWWDLHNGPASVSSRLPDGTTEYGDGGILSSGGCNGAVCEPQANTAFPAYYGLQAISRFAPGGAKMVGVTSSKAMVTAYAVKTSRGMNLVLVNHSPRSSEPVSISYSGFNPTSVISALQFSDAHPKLTKLSKANARSLTLAAYSITVLKLSGSSPRAAHLTARLFKSRTPSARWCACGRRGASIALRPVPAAPPASQVPAWTYGVAGIPVPGCTGR